MFGSSLVARSGPVLFSAAAHENLLSMLRDMGLPQPQLVVWADGLVGCFGGLGLLTGRRVRFFSTVVLAHFHSMIVIAKRRGGFPEPIPGGRPVPGKELSLFYCAAALSLALSGGGRWSSGGRGPSRCAAARS